MKNSEAVLKEERKGDDFINGDQGGGEIAEEKIKLQLVGAKSVYSGDTSKPSASPNQTNPTIDYKEIQLESTKEAMCEVREENERLKAILAQIARDYQSLQMHIFDIMKQKQANKRPAEGEPSFLQVHHEERELVSLCLGSGPRVMKKQEEKTNCNGKETNDQNNNQIKRGLTLGLECKMDEQENDVKDEFQLSNSPENSSEGTATKEETAIEDQRWPLGKTTKTLKHEEDEVSPQANIKRARVSVRTRCDAPTMNDGCQWRKYGQKVAKGNPCPRAYYRCTVAPGCPVRKQVQRCAEDISILISTYEGNHNHPLPISATAMASATVAAASMLISGSSSSLPGTAPPHITTGLNFSLPSSSHHNGQFYFTNPSISPSLSQPTVTLDLTNPSAATAYQQNGFSTSSLRSFSSQASFNFSPSESSSSWKNSSGYLNYGAHQPYYKSFYMGALRQPQEPLFHSYAHKQVPNEINDTMAKAMTSDPSFQSALAAAITSYVGGSVAGAIGEGSSGSGVGGELKWGEQLPLASSLAAAMTTIENSEFLAGSNLNFYPPSLWSSSKNGPDGTSRDNS